MSTFILSVDPSASKMTESSCIGWSLFRDGKLLEVGELNPDPPSFTRVRNWVRNKFKWILQEDNRPEVIVAVETAWLGKNPSVFMGLLQVKAHIQAVTLDACYLYREVSPMESFKASTGLTQYPLNDNGTRKDTRKPAIKAAIKTRYNLPEDTSEHIYDSLAIAEAIIKRGQPK